MTCNLIISSGFECNTIKTARGEMSYLATPFELVGGQIIGFYMFDHGSNLKVSDDGLLIHALMCNGFDLSSRKKWTSLKNIAQRHGFKLSEYGSISKKFIPDDNLNICRDLIMLIAEIKIWEQEVLDSGDLDLTLHSIVEDLLKRQFQKEPQRNVVIQGPHKSSYYFDFRVNGTLVDAFKPHANATGSRLRKITDIKRLGDEDFNFLLVLDDRDISDNTRLESELGILSSVATCTYLSSLKESVTNNENQKIH